MKNLFNALITLFRRMFSRANTEPAIEAAAVVEEPENKQPDEVHDTPVHDTPVQEPKPMPRADKKTTVRFVDEFAEDENPIDVGDNTSAGEQKRQWKFLLLDGGNVIGEYPADKDCITVGRNAGCDIFVTSNEISRKHCLICTISTGWTVEDCGSTNGTYINGKRCAPHTAYPIAEGQRIDIGVKGKGIILTEAE